MLQPKNKKGRLSPSLLGNLSLQIKVALEGRLAEDHHRDDRRQPVGAMAE
jgi:hypothetical protein